MAVAILTLALLTACGDAAGPPVGDFAALEGRWNATLFRWTRVANPQAGSVDLIALGGAMALDISADGDVLLTTREVGASSSESVLSSGRIVAGDLLELDTGGDAPVTLRYALAGDLLRLSGRLTLRPGGFGAEEEVDLEAVLIKSEGSSR